MNPVEFFSIASSLATCLSLTILVPAALVALKQLRESTKLRRMEGLFQAYKWMAKDTAIKERGQVYDLKESELPLSEISIADRKVIGNVCVTFDKLGNMAKHDLIPQDVFMDSHGDVVYKTWWAVEEYVEGRRHEFLGQYVPHFEHFTQEALEFMQIRQSESDLAMIKERRCKLLDYERYKKR